MTTASVCVLFVTFAARVARPRRRREGDEAESDADIAVMLGVGCRLVLVVALAAAAAAAAVPGCEDAKERLALARGVVECDATNFRADCVGAASRTNFEYSQNFEGYVVRGADAWNTWLENFFELNPDVVVRVVPGSEFCMPTRYAAEWVMNLTFAPTRKTLLNTRGVSIIEFVDETSDEMIRMKDFAPDLEIYGQLPSFGTSIAAVKRAIDACLKIEDGGCTSVEARRNITGALMTGMNSTRS